MDLKNYTMMGTKLFLLRFKKKLHVNILFVTMVAAIG